jgi:PhnB protein
MITHHPDQLKSAVFITFSGNCKKALTFYQSCFGGQLQWDTLEDNLTGYLGLVVSASLISERIIIYGSDLVHNDGRKLGNYISIFLYCKNKRDRKELIEKLGFNQKHDFERGQNDQLIELTDHFDVRWILGI